jgi:hypothetical protein
MSTNSPVPTKKNVIIGAASIFIGPSWDGVTGSSPAPAASGTTPYRTTIGADSNWRNVGYTQDGLTVSTTPSFGEVAVDQLLDSVKIFKDGMSLSATTTFAEATLENLLVAWGVGSSNLSSTATDATLQIDGGSLGDAPLERGLVAVGNGPEKSASNSYQERTYHLYRVLSVEGSSHSLARADATVIPVTFRALPADTGKYGIIRDRNNVV